MTHYKYKTALVAVLSALSLTACGNAQTEPTNTSAAAEATQAVTSAAEITISQETTLPAAETKGQESLRKLRETLEPSGAVAGIFFLGSYEQDLTDEAFLNGLSSAGYLERYAFIAEITQNRMAQTKGSEVYCIVPFDPQAYVKVTEWDEAQGPGTAGKVLYESYQGEPFLVRGNYSDIMSNLSVSIEDHYANKLQNYHPSIGCENGSVVTPSGDSPIILDFTIYPEFQS